MAFTASNTNLLSNIALLLAAFLAIAAASSPNELLRENAASPQLIVMPTDNVGSEIVTSTGFGAASSNDDKCAKCNVPVEQGGCKCDNYCDCKSSPGGKCAKCNLPAEQGGCKCDNNCDCKSGPAPGSFSGGCQWKQSTATWYEPNGGFGACDDKLQNDDMIVALAYQDLGRPNYPYPNCGQCMKVQCVGAGCKNNQEIKVTVKDRCMACESDRHRDLSKGAFNKIANLDKGVISIKYCIVSC